MKCTSNLCQDGLAPCPTPEYCDYVHQHPDDFADTEPADVPGNSISMIRWSIWLSIGLGVLLYLLGTVL